MAEVVLERGSPHTSAVKQLQMLLSQRGYKLKIDGEFGRWTDASVRQFQAAEGLEVDGVVGEATWAALRTPLGSGEAGTAPVIGLPTGLAGRALDIARRNIGLRERDRAGNVAGTNGGAEIAHIVGGGGVFDGFPPSPYYIHWRVRDAATLRSMPPWCALFVNYCVRAAIAESRGLPIERIDWSELPWGNWLGGVAQLEDWAEANGKLVPIAQTSPGMLFTMAREGSSSDPGRATRAGHVGFIVTATTDTLHTIEGNVSNMVAARTRKMSTVAPFAIAWW